MLNQKNKKESYMYKLAKNLNNQSMLMCTSMSNGMGKRDPYGF